MKKERLQVSESQARQDRIDAYLVKQQAIATEKLAVEAERARIEAAESAEHAAEHYRAELEKAKSNLADARLQSKLLREVDLPRAQAEVARIPANAAELHEMWKVFCSDPHRYGVWMQEKRAPNPDNCAPVPPGFREDPCPAIRLYLEAPAQLRGVQQKLAYLDSVIDDIERRFPELRDKACASALLV